MDYESLRLRNVHSIIAPRGEPFAAWQERIADEAARDLKRAMAVLIGLTHVFRSGPTSVDLVRVCDDCARRDPGLRRTGHGGSYLQLYHGVAPIQRCDHAEHRE